MTVTLVNQVPANDGYFLVRFGVSGGLHLVLLQTEMDGHRVIFGDVCPFRENKAIKCGPNSKCVTITSGLASLAWWSKEPIVVESKESERFHSLES